MIDAPRVRRHLLVALLVASLILVPFVDTAGAAGPAGSYQQSCQNISVSGSTLMASCRTRSGSWQQTQLPNFGRCIGDIWNADGALRCDMGSPPPGGSYTQSCRDAWVSGTTLNASCQRRDGGWQSTSLANFNQCVGGIWNADGTLRCNMGSPPPGGSYTQSCRDAWVSGTTLNASCQQRNGGWHATSLASFNLCVGGIWNADGTLRCNKGGAPPAGSYTRSCRDIWVDNGKLSATCDRFDGRPRDTQLDSPSSCRTEVSNVDGYLTCDRGTGPAPEGSYKRTCINVRVDGDTLSASCEVGQTALVRSPLNSTRLPGQMSSCRTPIANMFGNLTCERGTGPAPGGSYKATCWDITVNGATLSATCRRRAGGAYITTLNLSNNCRDIWNDDGKLRCSSGATSPGHPPQKPPQQVGIGKVNVYNCDVNTNANGDHDSIHVWVFDLTAGAPGDDKGEMAAQYVSGLCPGQNTNPATSVSLDDGHLYAIVAVDPQGAACTGNNPLEQPCQRQIFYVQGKKGGTDFRWVVQ